LFDFAARIWPDCPSMNKIAFIGAGRMASAIVNGLLASGARTASQIACLGGDDNTAAELASRSGITAAAGLPALLDGAGAVVLACKPQQLASLDPALAELASGKLILSILAGKRLDRLAQTFPLARNIVRAMPNTPGQIGAGITAWASRAPLSDGDRAIIDAILGALGKVVTVDEPQLDAVTALSGSGPGYIFEFAAALRDAGEAAGLPRETSRQLAIETLLGSARLLAASESEAETLRDQVTSPKGTTYAGLQRMESANFRRIIKETVLAAKHRSEELSKD
jgi:pyrroline-5-carboxylate reductase